MCWCFSMHKISIAWMLMLVKLLGLPAHLSYTTSQVMQFVLTIQVLCGSRTVCEAIRFERSLG